MSVARCSGYVSQQPNQRIAQWNRMEDIEATSSMSSHLIFGKRAKNMLQERHSIFKMVLGKLAVCVQIISRPISLSLVLN